MGEGWKPDREHKGINDVTEDEIGTWIMKQQKMIILTGLGRE